MTNATNGAVNGYYGLFMLPALHPSNTSTSLAAALNKVLNEAIAPYPGQFYTSVTTQTWTDFWAFYSLNNGPLDGGHDQVLGSRLLDKKALTNREAMKEAYKTFTANGSPASVYLVGGKNVMNARPRGGSNAVNSAWRKAYVHTSKLPFFKASETSV